MKKMGTIETISRTKDFGDKKIKGTTVKRKSSAKKKSSTTKPSVKKKTIKKTPAKRVTRRKRAPSMTKKDFESFQEKIVDNFVSMQKVMTNLAEKFDGLTKQLSKLLNLFDESAKALTEKEINLDIKGSEKEKEIIAKLNSVLDQNKLIAKGLTLIHENNVNSTNYIQKNMQKTNQLNKNSVSKPQIVPAASSFRRDVPGKNHSSEDNSSPEKISSQKASFAPQLTKSKVVEQEGPFNSGEF